MPIYTKINGTMRKIDSIKTKHNGVMVNIKRIMTKINGQMVKIFSKYLTHFYAYTPEGGTQENSYYTKDNPIIDNSLVVDIYNNGCTDLGNGVFQGVLGKIMQTTFIPEISTANTWEIATKYTFGTGSTFATVLGYGYSSGTSYTDCTAPYIGTENTSNFRVFLSTNGSSWDLLQNKDTGVAKTGTTWIKLKFTGTQYIFSYKKNEADNYTDVVLLESTTKAYCSAPLGFLNLPFNTYSYCSEGGTIDLTQTSITIDGNTRYLAYRPTPSILYDNTFNELNPQPTYMIDKGVIASDMQNGALIIPVHTITSSLDMVIHFKTNTSFPNYALCDSSIDGTARNNSIWFQNYNGFLQVWLSSNGTSDDIASDVSTGFNLSTNTEYWLKTTWDGNKYQFYLSTDGITYTLGNTIQSSVPINWTNNNLYLGNNYNSSYNQVYANYYVDDTYIKIDGALVFNGETAIEGVDYLNNGCTLTGFRKGAVIITSETPNIVAFRTPENDKEG